MDAREPLVSVIVPVYNVEKFLRKCLDSLINQTYKNLEILVVNDGSTDSSGAICDEYAQRDDRIRVFHKQNGGLASSRNYAIPHVTGDYISYIDSDDWVDLDLYRRVVDKFAAHPDIDVVYVDYNFVMKDSSYTAPLNIPRKGVSTKPTTDEPLYPELLELYARDAISPSACTKIYRKEILEGLRFVEGLNYEDVDYTFFATCRVKGYAALDEERKFIGYFYNQTNTTSITHTLRPDVEHALINLLRMAEQLSKTNPRLVPYVGTRARRQQDAILAHYKLQEESLRRVIPYISKVVTLPALPESTARALRYKFMALCPALSARLIRLWVKYK